MCTHIHVHMQLGKCIWNELQMRILNCFGMTSLMWIYSIVLVHGGYWTDGAKCEYCPKCMSVWCVFGGEFGGRDLVDQTPWSVAVAKTAMFVVQRGWLTDEMLDVADDDIPSPPDEAPSPVGSSPEDNGVQIKGTFRPSCFCWGGRGTGWGLEKSSMQHPWTLLSWLKWQDTPPPPPTHAVYTSPPVSHGDPGVVRLWGQYCYWFWRWGLPVLFQPVSFPVFWLCLICWLFLLILDMLFQCTCTLWRQLSFSFVHFLQTLP